MSRASQFGGQRATRSIVNLWSSSAGAAAVPYLNSTYFGTNLRSALSGAMTADTWKSVLSLSGGGGECSALAARTIDATSRTMGVRITVDGTVVYTGTTSAIAAADSGQIVAVGDGQYVSSIHAFRGTPPIRWNSSLVVELMSSLTETDKMGLLYLLNTN